MKPVVVEAVKALVSASKEIGLRDGIAMIKNDTDCNIIVDTYDLRDISQVLPNAWFTITPGECRGVTACSGIAGMQECLCFRVHVKANQTRQTSDYGESVDAGKTYRWDGTRLREIAGYNPPPDPNPPQAHTAPRLNAGRESLAGNNPQGTTASRLNAGGESLAGYSATQRTTIPQLDQVAKAASVMQAASVVTAGATVAGAALSLANVFVNREIAQNTSHIPRIAKTMERRRDDDFLQQGRGVEQRRVILAPSSSVWRNRQQHPDNLFFFTLVEALDAIRSHGINPPKVEVLRGKYDATHVELNIDNLIIDCEPGETEEETTVFQLNGPGRHAGLDAEYMFKMVKPFELRNATLDCQGVLFEERGRLQSTCCIVNHLGEKYPDGSLKLYNVTVLLLCMGTVSQSVFSSLPPGVTLANIDALVRCKVENITAPSLFGMSGVFDLWWNVPRILIQGKLMDSRSTKLPSRFWQQRVRLEGIGAHIWESLGFES